LSQAPASCKSVGTERRISTRLVMSNNENNIPAIAAARGVVNLDRTMVDGWFIASLLSYIEGFSQKESPYPNNKSDKTICAIDDRLTYSVLNNNPAK
jgi:hypothetical protein